MQKYIYRLQKEIKVTTNYYQHMGVNSGTEIYYKLNYPKKDCYHKINQHFKEKKKKDFKIELPTILIKILIQKWVVYNWRIVIII